MKGYRLLWVGGTLCAGWLLFFAWLEAAAGRGPFAQLTPPLIVEIQPPANGHSAPATTALTVTYDQPIDPATVGLATFPVHGQYNGRLAGAYTVNGAQAVFQPAAPLWPGELVQATVTTGTLNPAGQSLSQPHVWQFRTGVRWGTGLYVTSGQGLGNATTFDVDLGDLDGDGDLDAFVANGRFNEPNEVWFNDGSGQFSDSGQRLGNHDSRGAALGDLDGDGDLDAVIANWSDQYNDIWLNDGSGHFTTTGQQFDRNDGHDIGLGDLDGDGDLDVFVVNGTYQADRAWFNDGHGFVVASGQTLGSDRGREVRLADLDGDGDLDAFVANRGPNRVWLNNGSGQFSNTGQSLGEHWSPGLAIGDVDQDGDLDAFTANTIDPAPSQAYNRLWLNNGQGFFSDSGQLLGDAPSQSVVLGDVDGDGDLDAAVANGSDVPSEIWLNDGLGSFINAGQSLALASSDLDLGDLDGDGDLDLFFGTGVGLPNEVWLNYSEPVSGLSAGNDSPTVAGQSTHLTATITGGTEVSYTWDLGDGSQASGPLVNHIYPAAGSYTAVVTASNNLNHQVASTAVTIQIDADILLPVIPQPLRVDLALNIIDSPDPVFAGDRLTYSLTVQNLGLAAANEVQIADHLPDGVVFIDAASSPLCQHAAGVVSCHLGTLAGGGSNTVLIVVDVELAAVPLMTNEATVASQQPDGWPENNSAVQETTVLPP